MKKIIVSILLFFFLFSSSSASVVTPTFCAVLVEHEQKGVLSVVDVVPILPREAGFLSNYPNFTEARGVDDCRNDINLSVGMKIEYSQGELPENFLDDALFSVPVNSYTGSLGSDGVSHGGGNIFDFSNAYITDVMTEDESNIDVQKKQDNLLVEQEQKEEQVNKNDMISASAVKILFIIAVLVLLGFGLKRFCCRS